ncbi:response regulator [Actinomycetota bacterium Odt1-20B]
MPDDAKILIVDDHRDTLFALASALDPLGYELAQATTGEQALKEILRGHIGLILLDLRMPDVSGLDVVRYTRRLEQTQHIPVILLTGFGLTHDLSLVAFQLGVADVVMKPIDPLTLRTKVRYLYATYREMRKLRQRVSDLEAQMAESDTAADADGHRRAQPPATPRVPAQPTAATRRTVVTLSDIACVSPPSR